MVADIETIINELNAVLNQMEKPMGICSNEQGYLQAEIGRVSQSFSDQPAGQQIERMLRSSVSDIIYSTDQLVSAQEGIKKIIQNAVSK